MSSHNIIYKRTVYCYNHQRKGSAYIAAMNKAGYQNTSTPLMAQVVFIDIDNPGRVNRHRVNLRAGKSRLFIYPHSARPAIAWDGLFAPSQYTTAQFVAADGHMDILRAYGYKKPLHTAGWSYCPILPFMPNEHPRKILFAPIHPTKRGFLSGVDKKINAASFERLLKLVKTGDIELTVRFIRGLQNNGIWADPNVTFVEGDTNLCYSEIDNTDLIVAHQTFAYIAMARGKPVLMMSEETPPRNGGSEETFTYVTSWNRYKDLLMYPLDILAEDDTLRLIQRASLSEEFVKEWKDRMIGHAFDPQAVVKTVESYL